jgi:hypothetical protein
MPGAQFQPRLAHDRLAIIGQGISARDDNRGAATYFVAERDHSDGYWSFATGAYVTDASGESIPVVCKQSGDVGWDGRIAEGASPVAFPAEDDLDKKLRLRKPYAQLEALVRGRYRELERAEFPLRILGEPYRVKLFISESGTWSVLLIDRFDVTELADWGIEWSFVSAQRHGTTPASR